MSPQRTTVHEFVRDLNKHLLACHELYALGVPEDGTDEMDLYMERLEDLEHQRADLEKRLGRLLYAR